MKHKKTMIRQGDVLLIHSSPTPKIPTGATEVAMGKLGPVLALGEATGHHHTVVARPEVYVPHEDLTAAVLEELGTSLADHAQAMLDRAASRSPRKVGAELRHLASGEPACKLYDEGGDLTLVVERFTLLRHEEHPAVELARGTWKVKRQAEYTPEGWRAVVD